MTISVNSINVAGQNDPQAANSVQNQPAAKPASSQNSATVQSSLATNTPADTVQISSAAKALAQEVTETRAQTTQEALKGDHQAQRLLAKETPAKIGK